MKIKRIPAFAIAAAVLAVAVVLALPCSAGWSGTVSAADWWNSQTSTCNLYCYSSSGALLNTAVPVNPAAFISRLYDISPYVSWTSVTSKYISNRYACIESTFTPLPNSASMYGLQLQFRDKWTLIGGRTYEFIILRNSIAFYNSQGSPLSTGTQLLSVSLGGLAMTLEDKKLDTDLFDRAIRCTVTPSSDVTVQTISVSFKSMYNPTVSASKVVLNLGFSDVVSYTGSLDNVVVNPTLDNINKQVDEINGKIDGIIGTPDDTAPNQPDLVPGIDSDKAELEDVKEKEAVIGDSLKQFLDNLDVPDGNNFFTQVGAFINDPDTLKAIHWWGDRYDVVTAFQPMTVLLIFSTFSMLTAFIFGCCRYARFRFSSRDSETAQAETKSTYGGWDTASKSSFSDEFLDKALAKTYRDFNRGDK